MAHSLINRAHQIQNPILSCPANTIRLYQGYIIRINGLELQQKCPKNGTETLKTQLFSKQYILFSLHWHIFQN